MNPIHIRINEHWDKISWN